MPRQNEEENLSKTDVSTANSDRHGSSNRTGSRPANYTHMMMLQHDAIPPAKYMTMTEMTEDFWRQRKHKMATIPEAEMATKSRNMSLPMARVKKIMRIDDDVRNFMIAADAPIFMAQAAELFIEEMTSMGWQYVSEARRRILQKTDIATAVQNNDQFDFLIDFLPPKCDPSPSTNLLSTGCATMSSGHTSSYCPPNTQVSKRNKAHSGAGASQPVFENNQLRSSEHSQASSKETGPCASIPSTPVFNNTLTTPFAPAIIESHTEKKKLKK
ncbi:CBN-NFYC-1 protein [Caenorhabditis brenneri]|uniref:CBN-NFYC-1 protein n=1 Tax=Caenorhabditis brenneri TaxID=135651 RepID=G0N4L2_CAEBE|nr:CBN-NFYC-1 protein [Caenorhabditis brenneri]